MNKNIKKLLLGVFSIASIIAIITPIIIINSRKKDLKLDLGKKAITDAKTTALKFINGLSYPAQNDNLHDAKLFGTILNAKIEATNLINIATSVNVINSYASSLTVGSQIINIKSKINAYNASTGKKAITDAKTTALKFINGLSYPAQNDNLHDAKLFGTILNAKIEATNLINIATSVNVINSYASSLTVGSQIINIKSKINAYNASTGKKAIADAKTIALGFINGLSYPTPNNSIHNEHLFWAILDAKTEASELINTATSANVINSYASSLTVGSAIIDIKSKINAYNSSSGTIQAIVDAKIRALGFINGLSYPTQNDVLHSATLFGEILNAKTKAARLINSATSFKAIINYASSLTFGSEIVNINSKINAYNASTGTKAIADSKIRALGFINGLSYPTQNNAIHDAKLFGAILDAKTEASELINTATSANVINSYASSLTVGSQIININSKINAYNASTGTIKNIADAQIHALGFINGLPYPTQNNALHDAKLFGPILDAKIAAIRLINTATSVNVIINYASSLIVGSKIININSKINAYNASTGTNQIIANAKKKALGFIEGLPYPNQDNAAHEEVLFWEIANTKMEEIKLIQAAKSVNIIDSYASSSKVGTSITEIQLKINAYNSSTGTDKAITDAKTTALRFINGLSYPAQNDQAHNETLFREILNAKTTYTRLINASTSIDSIVNYAWSLSDGLAIIDIRSKINAYNSSTGIDKILENQSWKLVGYLEKHNDKLEVSHTSTKYADKTAKGKALLKAINETISGPTIHWDWIKILSGIKNNDPFPNMDSKPDGVSLTFGESIRIFIYVNQSK